MPVNLASPFFPPSLSGLVSVGAYGIPRYFATIWSDVLKASLTDATHRKHLAAMDHLYSAVHRQRGTDCLDQLLADVDADAIEECLMGFLAELRNKAVIDRVDHSSTWVSAVMFVTDTLRYAGNSAGIRAADMETRLLRLETMYRQLQPHVIKPPPPIRALPPSVIEDLYEIFRPDSPRNPFKTEKLRWRNLLIFMLLLRLGLRRSESALLLTSSLKEDFDPAAGKKTLWLDVEETNEFDPRYEKPSLKTGASRRQLPVQQQVVDLYNFVIGNRKKDVTSPYLLISQKDKPLSLRSLSEVFETATLALSSQAKKSLEKQGLDSVSCHDLRHTSAVVRMRRYQDAGDELDLAVEKLREYFGWSRDSEMPRLYAKAYFETRLAEVWDENYEIFVDALRRSVPEALK